MHPRQTVTATLTAATRPVVSQCTCKTTRTKLCGSIGLVKKIKKLGSASGGLSHAVRTNHWKSLNCFLAGPLKLFKSVNTGTA